MNRAQIVSLATVIQDIRPDWQQAGIITQLRILAASWTGTHAAFYVHVVDIAADPQAQTPGAFNAIPPRFAEPPPINLNLKSRHQQETDSMFARAMARAEARDQAAENAKLNGSASVWCAICNLSERACRAANMLGPDPHEFQPT